MFVVKAGASQSIVYLYIYQIMCLNLRPFPYFPCLASRAPATATCFTLVFPETISFRDDNIPDQSSNSVNGMFSLTQYWIRSNSARQNAHD
jgi:hypothetical protein